MKILPILVLISAPAFAETDADILCPLVGDAAQSVIQAYFEGLTLSDAMKIADGDELLTSIVMDAYDEPRFSDEEVIAAATFDFRNKWEHDCFQYYATNL